MKDYFSKWTWARGMQLAVGVYFLRDYYIDGGQLILGFAVLMLAQAILNIGCFSSKGCSAPKSTDNGEPFKADAEIEYEEIK